MLYGCYSLSIHWLESSAKIVVHLEDFKPTKNVSTPVRWSPCSEKDTAKDCLLTNGWGTDGSGYVQHAKRVIIIINCCLWFISAANFVPTT